MAEKAKLRFITSSETLKSPIDCKSIAQVLLHFNYVERWGDASCVKEQIPEDSNNIKSFFSAIRKMSETGFQVKKFKEVWTKFNMEDITDYTIEGNEGVSDGN